MGGCTPANFQNLQSKAHKTKEVRDKEQEVGQSIEPGETIAPVNNINRLQMN
jgi:hypothetical protein